MKLSEIIRINDEVKNRIETGAAINYLVDIWDLLQVLCATIINSEAPGLPPQVLTDLHCAVFIY
jgi:DNA-directed RNA polymerase III subunit RPC1